MAPAEIYAEFKKRGGIADLSSRAKFRLTGADRVRFLNGQVSNDVRKLAPGETIHACVLTAKGKLCGDVFISAGGDFLLVDAEAALREDLFARLEKYVIADEVAIEDATEKHSLFHVVVATEGDGNFSSNIESLIPENGILLRSARFSKAGFDFLVAPESAADALSKATQHVLKLDETMLETIRIEAGVPRWGFELDAEILPQEALLERDAVDFHKGCYVGQEVVSRIKSVGHVNKQLRGFAQIDGDAPLRAGMKLFDGEREAGWLTSAAYSFGLARHAALGYLKRGADAATLVARDEAGSCRVEIKNLPLVP